MLLAKEQILHINSITHDGKVVLLATDTSGKLWYTIKQDGFEDSYLSKPPGERKGWEDWQALQLPDESPDSSVVAKEAQENKTQDAGSSLSSGQFMMQSMYEKSASLTQPTPVQLVSGLGHLYIFRQSKSHTLLVDRFVLDGIGNRLIPKLEVRFRESRQKYKAQNEAGRNGLKQADVMDFRDPDGKSFFEPTTELSMVNHLTNGWFSVVLLPTEEQDRFYWHIFAYNSLTKMVELSSIRSTLHGLFDLKDLDNRPGILRYAMQLKQAGGTDLIVNEGLAASKYDLQQEVSTRVGDRLLRKETRVMLAVPTDQGTAALSFAAKKDGSLSQVKISTKHDVSKVSHLYNQPKEIMLPDNTLDEIKGILYDPEMPKGEIKALEWINTERFRLRTDKTEGVKYGFEVNVFADQDGINGEYSEVKTLTLGSVSALNKNSLSFTTSSSGLAVALAKGDKLRLQKSDKMMVVYIEEAIASQRTGTITVEIKPIEGEDQASLNSYVSATVVHGNMFDITTPQKLGSWKLKKQMPLVFEGKITAVEDLNGGKLRIHTPYHELATGAYIQIANASAYMGASRIIEQGDNSLTLQRFWQPGEIINLEDLNKNRRGIILDGGDDYIEIKDLKIAKPLEDQDFERSFSIWVFAPQKRPGRQSIIKGDVLELYLDEGGKLVLEANMMDVPAGNPATLTRHSRKDEQAFPTNQWVHCAGSIRYEGTTHTSHLQLVVNGEEVGPNAQSLNAMGFEGIPTDKSEDFYPWDGTGDIAYHKHQDTGMESLAVSNLLGATTKSEIAFYQRHHTEQWQAMNSAVITAPTVGVDFGKSLAFNEDGSHLIIGVPGANNGDGEVHIYSKHHIQSGNDTYWNWELYDSFQGPDNYQSKTSYPRNFGASLCFFEDELSRKELFIGAPGEAPNNDTGQGIMFTGVVHIYVPNKAYTEDDIHTSLDSWLPKDPHPIPKIDPDYAISDFATIKNPGSGGYMNFGRKISLGRSTNTDTFQQDIYLSIACEEQGRVFIYTKQLDAGQNTGYYKKGYVHLTVFDNNHITTVRMQGKNMLVGTSTSDGKGKVWVFEKKSDQDSWYEDNDKSLTLPPASTDTHYGRALVLGAEEELIIASEQHIYEFGIQTTGKTKPLPSVLNNLRPISNLDPILLKAGEEEQLPLFEIGKSFQGKLSEAQVWERAFDQGDIYNHMFLRLTGREQGLWGYWRLNAIGHEGDLRYVYDFSIHGNRGIVHGDPFISEKSLDRLMGGKPVQEYLNQELFAGTQAANYTESFEFKVTHQGQPVPNFDVQNVGGFPLFRFSYWGKKDRHTIEKIPTGFKEKQANFEAIPNGDGWYRASCTFEIPPGCGLIRLFNLKLIRGDNWDQLHIRRHKITLNSNSVTEQYIQDEVLLNPLGGDDQHLQQMLADLMEKEQEEREILRKIESLKDRLGRTNALEVAQKMLAWVNGGELLRLRQAYRKELVDLSNFQCFLMAKGENSIAEGIVRTWGISDSESYWPLTWENDDKWRYLSPFLEYPYFSFQKDYSLDTYFPSQYLQEFLDIPDIEDIDFDEKWPVIEAAKAAISKNAKAYQASSDEDNSSRPTWPTCEFERVSPDTYALIVDGKKITLAESSPYGKGGIKILQYNSFLNDGGEKELMETFISYKAFHIQIQKIQGNADQGINDFYRLWGPEQDMFLESRFGDLNLYDDVNDPSHNKFWLIVPTNIPSQQGKRKLESTRNKYEGIKRLKRDLEDFIRKEKQDAGITSRTIKQRIKTLDSALPAIRTRLSSNNQSFVTSVSNTRNTALSMHTYLPKEKELNTQGALLSFAKAHSSISMLESVDGNIHLNYFDQSGRMRQSQYDAVADYRDANAESWTMDGMRLCKNLNLDDSIISFETGKEPELTNNWTVESWLEFPLAPNSSTWDARRWNTILSNQQGRQIAIKHGRWIGIESRGFFKAAAYDLLEEVTPGWHHLAIVSQELSPEEKIEVNNAGKVEIASHRIRFYLDGKIIGQIEEMPRSISLDGHGCVMSKTVHHFWKKDQTPQIKELSASAWIRIVGAGTEQTMLKVQNESGQVALKIGIDRSKKLTVQLGDSKRIESQDRIPEHDWTHVALSLFYVEDKYIVFAYLNGQMINIKDSQTSSTFANALILSLSLPAGPYHVHIGGEWNNNQLEHGWKGDLTQVCLWDIFKFQQEVESDMFRSFSGNEGGLLSCWEFKDDEVIDISSSAAHASYHGSFAGKSLPQVHVHPIGIQGSIAAIGNHVTTKHEPIGKIAEVRIWEEALNPHEIEINSKTALTGNEPGLLAYYPLNTHTRDASGNGQNGTDSQTSDWACAAPIGRLGQSVMQFDGQSDFLHIEDPDFLPTDVLTVSVWIKATKAPKNRSSIIKNWRDQGPGRFHLGTNDKATDGSLELLIHTDQNDLVQLIDPEPLVLNQWVHVTFVIDYGSVKLYRNAKEVVRKERNSQHPLTDKINDTSVPLTIGGMFDAVEQNAHWPWEGELAQVRIWDRPLSEIEIVQDMDHPIHPDSYGLIAHWPLDVIHHGISLAADNTQVLYHKQAPNLMYANYPAVVKGNPGITAMQRSAAVVASEYSNMRLGQKEDGSQELVAMMRRFFAMPMLGGVELLFDQRIEELEKSWIGNAQLNPTLLGYIEGAPPVPSENLTLKDDYSGATSVTLSQANDVQYSWKRSQDGSLGISLDTALGLYKEIKARSGFLVAISQSLFETKLDFKAKLDFAYKFLNSSTVSANTTKLFNDSLTLRGSKEAFVRIPQLGERFIPKNVGYALVISSLADVYVLRLKRSKRMVSYQVTPVPNMPPDINTITFMMNPAYTKNGTLDGLNGSWAADDRLYAHVPNMRAEYGSLYPASYFRPAEAYQLKNQIDQIDKERESYFINFDSRLIDEISLDREIDADTDDYDSLQGINMPGEGITSPNSKIADRKESSASDTKADVSDMEEELEQEQEEKEKEIKAKISDAEKRVHASAAFAGWQKKMENLLIRAGKRNIVNTYVWDADGGLRSEVQQFANTIEHAIGGSVNLTGALGAELEFEAFLPKSKLTPLFNMSLTQTMNKSNAFSKGFSLNVKMGGVEFRGITDQNDYPILPGEKVDRYRFMSFYLDGATQHFKDFFSKVVDPEWLMSNDEEARALRQISQDRPNKTWRVLHRVTYVERPALMGFGSDTRKVVGTEVETEALQILEQIKQLEGDQVLLRRLLDTIKKKLQT
ncbi:MAG: LamG-like jellyroll fold domain-containing protein [Bacteroidota bacterium]